MTPDTYTVIFDRVRLPARIGVYDHEYQAAQPIIISLRLTAAWPAKGVQQLDDVIDYAWVLGRLKGVIADKHYDLLEVLACDFADTLMEDTRITAAEITILKTEQMKETDGVGGTFTFSRK